MELCSIGFEHYRAVVEHAPMMLWRAGRDGRFEYVNSRWLEFTGRRLEDEIGYGWLESIHPDDRDHSFSVYADRVERRLPWEKEFRLLRHDGVYRYVLEKGAPYDDDDGGFQGFIGSARASDER